MNLKFTLAVAGGLAAVSLALPSFAVQTNFANFGSETNKYNLKWSVVKGVGTLTNTAANAVDFNFTLPDAATQAIGELDATFTLLATSTTKITNPLEQSGIDGSFAFTYTGASFVYKGKTINAGANLLSGTFTGAAIRSYTAGGGLANSFLDDTGGTSTLTMTSAVLPITGPIEVFSWDITGTNFPLSYVKGKLLSNFKGGAGGRFDDDTIAGGGGGVPEPASWALMLVGIGAIGFAMRRQARAAA